MRSSEPGLGFNSWCRRWKALDEEGKGAWALLVPCRLDLRCKSSCTSLTRPDIISEAMIENVSKLKAWSPSLLW
jgi:hypothetical protein